MNAIHYWKQKMPIIFLDVLCMTGLAVFLHVAGNSFDGIFLILLIWIVILAAYLRMSYCRWKVQMEPLLKLAEQSEECYLLFGVMEKPERG